MDFAVGWRFESGLSGLLGAQYCAAFTLFNDLADENPIVVGGSASPMVDVRNVDCGWTKQLQHLRITCADHATCRCISVATVRNLADAISDIVAPDRDYVFRAIRPPWKTSVLAMGYRLIR